MLLAVLIACCSVVAGNVYLPEEAVSAGSMGTCVAASGGGPASWVARLPGERWPAEGGECAELTCQPHGAITVHRCLVTVSEPPPGCVLAALPAASVGGRDRSRDRGRPFPDCCPTLLCPPAVEAVGASTHHGGQGVDASAADAADSTLVALPLLLSALGLLVDSEAMTATPAPPVIPATPATPLAAGTPWKQWSPEAAEAPVVAGKAITGKALRFLRRFLGAPPSGTVSSSEQPRAKPRAARLQGGGGALSAPTATLPRPPLKQQQEELDIPDDDTQPWMRDWHSTPTWEGA